MQVKGPVVSVLTNAAIPVSEISRKPAAAKLEDALTSGRTKSDDEFSVAARRLEKARSMLALASKD